MLGQRLNLMQGQSYQVKIVLEQYDAWNKTSPSWKNPLGLSPVNILIHGYKGKAQLPYGCGLRENR